MHRGLGRVITLMAMLALTAIGASAGEYKGHYCEGKGDVEYLQLIDRSFEFFHPSADVPNISMLYNSDWDCLVEGPMWDAWWVQNSYGTTYCALPFLQEPWTTFLQHSQDLWFKWQGDGKKKGINGHIAPEGSLCDCARPDGTHYVQGDCNWAIHDWFFEAAAAGVVMQAEMLLINRNMKDIRHYLPYLQRACDFIETRRDPKNGLFLVGPAANLLAPSYAGVRQADGKYGKAYLAGLSITYLAALDRMVEVLKLAGDEDKVHLYEQRLKMTRESLKHLITPAGYFVKSIDPDGTKHGVIGQSKYGYFEAVANVDAMAFRVADDAQSEKIYWKIASLPELRPHDFIITNYPSLDDTYENWGSTQLGGLWEFGRWVNGGAWSTVEARAIMAYYRLGKFEDINKSARHSMKLADEYQMDAPLPNFGGDVWFKDRQTNLCYDALGIPAATIRGLFEYIYRADSLTLYPHIPRSISEYSQNEPIRFGKKQIRLRVTNGGPNISSVKINGKELNITPSASVTLPYETLPDDARVEIVMGSPGSHGEVISSAKGPSAAPAKADLPESLAKPYAQLMKMQPKTNYERAYLAETIRAFDAYRERSAASTPGFSAEKRAAVLKMYEDAAMGLYKGLNNLLK